MLALGLVAALPAGAATLSDLDQGKALIEREHYTDAMRLLDPLAALDER